MKRKTLLIIVLLMISQISFAQLRVLGIGGNHFVKAKVNLTDGSVKEGLIQLPKLPSKQKIKFKESKDGEEKFIKILKIESFTTFSETGESFTFETHFVDQSRRLNADRVTKFKVFLIVAAKGFADLFVIGDEYRTKKDGTVYLYSATTATGEGRPNFNYYIKKRDKDFAELFVYEHPDKIILPDVSRKSLIKSMEAFMPECPDLIEKVRNKELDPENIKGIFELYNKYMAKK